MGNEIITLQNGELNAGRHALQWNANNAYGQKVPSGLYLYKVTSDNRSLTGKNATYEVVLNQLTLKRGSFTPPFFLSFSTNIFSHE